MSETFFFTGCTFFPWGLGLKPVPRQWSCRPRGMILKHFAPKNAKIGGLEESGGPFGVVSYNIGAESPPRIPLCS